MDNASGGAVIWKLDVDSKGLNKGLGKASKEVDKFGGKTQKTSEGSTTAFSGIAKIGLAAVAAAAVAAGVAIVKNIGGAVRRVDTLNNFPKVMANLGYGADESTKAINDLDMGVRGLPTSLDQIASAMQNISPSTGSLQEATDLTLALNNALIAGGKDAGIQASAMEQFSQAIAKGKPDMMEWRSLAGAMPGQLKQIANSLGFDNWQKMAAAVSSGELSFKDVQKAMVDLNKNGLGEFPSFADQAKNAAGGIQTGFANMQTSITRGLAKVFDKIGQENISSALAGIGKAFESVLGWVVAFVTFLQENEWALWAFAGALSGIAVAIGVSVAPAVWGAVTAFGALVLAAAPFILIGAAIGLVALTIYKNWDTIKNFFIGLWQWISANWPLLLVMLTGPIGLAILFVKKNWGKIKDAFKSAFDWVKRNWPLLLAIITGPIGLAVLAIVKNFDKIKAAAQKVKDWITGIFKKLGDIGSSIFKGAVNGVLSVAEDTVNGFIRLINGAVGLINKIPGVNIGTVGEVSFARLAEGGIVKARPGGIMANIGEGGEDEAVIPLSKLDQVIGGKGGGNVTVNVNMSGIMARSRSDLREIGKDIIRSVNEELRSKGVDPIGGIV